MVFVASQASGNVNLRFKRALQVWLLSHPHPDADNDRMFTFRDMLMVHRQSPRITYALFFIQDFVRKKILGLKYWERKRGKIKEVLRLELKYMKKSALKERDAWTRDQRLLAFHPEIAKKLVQKCVMRACSVALFACYSVRLSSCRCCACPCSRLMQASSCARSSRCPPPQ